MGRISNIVKHGKLFFFLEGDVEVPGCPRCRTPGACIRISHAHIRQQSHPNARTTADACYKVKPRHFNPANPTAQAQLKLRIAKSGPEAGLPICDGCGAKENNGITKKRKAAGGAGPAKRSRDVSVARKGPTLAAPDLHAVIAGITGLETADEFERVNTLMRKSGSPELWQLYTGKLRTAVSLLGCTLQ
jgi:hypothetical protein